MKPAEEERKRSPTFLDEFQSNGSGDDTNRGGIERRAAMGGRLIERKSHVSRPTTNKVGAELSRDHREAQNEDNSKSGQHRVYMFPTFFSFPQAKKTPTFLEVEFCWLKFIGNFSEKENQKPKKKKSTKQNSVDSKIGRVLSLLCFSSACIFLFLLPSTQTSW